MSTYFIVPVSLTSCPSNNSTYNQAMFQFSRTIRSLVVAGLIFSLGVAVLSPSLMAAAVGESAVAADSSAVTTCCCGTATGNCCGMACCGVDAPKQQRMPVPHEQRSELAGSLLLSFCQTWPQLVTVDVQDSRGWDDESAVAEVRISTLQALHVLLQT